MNTVHLDLDPPAAETHVGLAASPMPSKGNQPDVSEVNEPTTGIPNADKPGRWFVPPWPVHASLCDVVRHFLCFTPKDNASTTEKLAYYKAYLAAMEAAPRHELKDHCGWRWYEDLRGCIAQCVTTYQDKLHQGAQASMRPGGPGGAGVLGGAAGGLRPGGGPRDTRSG